ncbi:hypothetical protein EAI28_22925 [Faecalicatena contorta]|nr:hypothetical protein [Faecalicatena contorta]
MKGGGSVEEITTDQIAGAIQYMADNWETIKAGIGGGSYELPAATTSTLGGVKKSAAVVEVSAADATAAGEAYDQTVAQSVVTLANGNKVAINDIIAKLKAAGIME